MEKEKENSCAVFIKSINRAREIRKFQVADLKLTNGRLRKLANKQLRNVQKSVMQVQSCCFALLPFSLPSFSLLKLPIVVIRKCCYHGNVTSHFSSLLLADKSVLFFFVFFVFVFIFSSPLLLVRSCGLLLSIRCLQCTSNCWLQYIGLLS